MTDSSVRSVARTNVNDIDREHVRQLVTVLVDTVAQTIAGDENRPAQLVFLSRLATLVMVRSVAEDLAAVAAVEAARHGANYPAIAEATGTTRQNARIRWPGLSTRPSTPAGEPSSSLSADESTPDGREDE